MLIMDVIYELQRAAIKEHCEKRGYETAEVNNDREKDIVEAMSTKPRSIAIYNFNAEQSTENQGQGSNGGSNESSNESSYKGSNEDDDPLSTTSRERVTMPTVTTTVPTVRTTVPMVRTTVPSADSITCITGGRIEENCTTKFILCQTRIIPTESVRP